MKIKIKTGVFCLLIVTAICTFSLGASAWGPASRETFTTDNPPAHVAFNSITNNPGWGDERGIMQIKETDEPDSEYRSGITLEPGKTYTVRAYFHNNATASANGLNFDGPGVAHGAYARVSFPGYVDGSEYATFVIGADNAQHFDAAGNDLGREVFGNITLRSERGLQLQYVDGSARLHNFADAESRNEIRFFSLPTDLFGAGALIGFNAMDGIIPGGQGYDGVITFEIHVPVEPVSKAIDRTDTDGDGGDETDTDDSNGGADIEVPNTGGLLARYGVSGVSAMSVVAIVAVATGVWFVRRKLSKKA